MKRFVITVFALLTMNALGANNAVQVDDNGVLTYPADFIRSNNIATLSDIVNSSNAINQAALNSYVPTNSPIYTNTVAKAASALQPDAMLFVTNSGTITTNTTQGFILMAGAAASASDLTNHVGETTDAHGGIMRSASNPGANGQILYINTATGRPYWGTPAIEGGIQYLLTSGVARVNGRYVTTNYTVTVSNGTWDGTTATLTPTGTITVVSTVPIARWEYAHSTHMGMGLTDLIDTGSWVTNAHGLLSAGDIYSVRSVGNETTDIPSIGEEGPVSISLSNLVVWTWGAPGLCGTTNSFEGTHVTVDDPAGELDPVNLRTMQERIADVAASMTPSRWADYDANGTGNKINGVNMGGRRVYLDNQWSMLGSGGYFALSYNGKDILYVSMSNRLLSIAGFTAGPLMTVRVSTNTVTSKPWIEYTTDLSAGNWFEITNATSTYPTKTNGTYVMTFSNAWTTAFFRAVQASTNVNGLVVTVPLTVPAITLGGVTKSAWPVGATGATGAPGPVGPAGQAVTNITYNYTTNLVVIQNNSTTTNINLSTTIITNLNVGGTNITINLSTNYFVVEDYSTNITVQVTTNIDLSTNLYNAVDDSKWPTNQPFVSALIWTNAGANTITTNMGLITATINTNSGAAGSSFVIVGGSGLTNSSSGGSNTIQILTTDLRGTTWPKAHMLDQSGAMYWSDALVYGSGGVNVSYYTNAVVFSALSSTSSVDQTFVVPGTVSNILAQAWGAGGSGGDNAVSGSIGGQGGYSYGVITVEPNETLTVRIGQGGTYNTAVSALPGGGRGKSTSLKYSNGGGYTALLRGTNVLILSGGGGGGGYGQVGGAGGGSTGGAGISTVATPAQGGSQTSGGYFGGSYLQGASCTNSLGASTCVGGGGGGYYGGGCITNTAGSIQASGAGGSCYARPGFLVQRGNNSGAEDYPLVTPAGAGGAIGANGAPGSLLLRYP